MTGKPECGQCSRRQVLLAVAASSAASVMACGGAAGDPEPFGDVEAGLLSEIPVGTVRRIVAAPAFIARDEVGLYTMTSTCTHEGCDLSVPADPSSGSVQCGCHGARFDLDGNVLSGPAESPLAHFSVEVMPDGIVVVRRGQRVSAEVRTNADVLP